MNYCYFRDSLIHAYLELTFSSKYFWEAPTSSSKSLVHQLHRNWERIFRYSRFQVSEGIMSISSTVNGIQSMKLYSSFSHTFGSLKRRNPWWSVLFLIFKPGIFWGNFVGIIFQYRKYQTFHGKLTLFSTILCFCFFINVYVDRLNNTEL